jgi:hypothetical protein
LEKICCGEYVKFHFHFRYEKRKAAATRQRLGAAGRHHDNHTEGKNWWSKGLTVNQQLALEALRNVVIDSGNKVVSASLWHEEHRQKCPDLARQRAGEARHALIEAGLVAADKNKVWLVNDNNDL